MDRCQDCRWWRSHFPPNGMGMRRCEHPERVEEFEGKVYAPLTFADDSCLRFARREDGDEKPR